MVSEAVRVRFAPSPTGYLHIGGARTALFNWLIAQQSPGGRFILRIEDTDRSRHVGDSVAKILEDLRWLGLQWDEGPEVGGPYGPYFQSERLPLYQQHVQRLLENGRAYYALETPEELAAMREAAKGTPGGFKYRRPDPLPTVAEGEAARAAGRAVVVRLKMPNRDIRVRDEILGEVTLTSAELEDFVIQKADGWPTYHLSCVVDDAAMEITHVLRGQEHLMNTPKHIALQEALGFPTPRYAHLPIIFNMNGTKMSKRDKERALAAGQTPPEIDVHDFRAAGYLPEALLNFISLLGWSSGDEQEQLTLEETIARFAVSSIGKGNAKFDRDKLLAFNTDWAARLTPERLRAAFRDYLVVSDSSLRDLADAEIDEVLRLTRGFRTFRDVERKIGFAFVEDDSIDHHSPEARKVFEKGDGQGYAMLEKVLPSLERLGSWSAAGLQSVLEQFCAAEGVKFGAVAQPIRAALSGGTISPGITETLVLLGKERTINRIRRALTHRASPTHDVPDG